NIRGIDGNRVAIQLDGIRQPEDFVAQSFLDAGGPGRIYFDPAILEQLEIYKSATSTLYGSDAMGGTVEGRTVGPVSLLGEEMDGLTSRNTVTYATVNASINNRLVAAAGDGKLGTSLVYSFRDGSERENNGEIAPNPEDFSSHALVLTGAAKGEAWRIEGTLDSFDLERFTDAVAAEGVFFGGAIVNDNVTQDDKRERLRLSLRGTYEPAGGSALVDAGTAHVYWQEATFSTENVQQGTVQFGPFPSPRNRVNDLRYTTEITGLDLQGDKLFAAGENTHLLRYGVEGSWTDVSSQFMRIDTSPDGEETIEDRIGMAPSEVLRFGLFLIDEISLGLDEKWVITAGLRYDRYEVRPENTDAFLERTVPPGGSEPVRAIEYANDAFAPSLSVLYRWGENLNTYFTYGRGIRNPTAEELNGVFTHGTDFIVVPNPDLEEERSDSFELGLQGSGTDQTFQVAAFFNQYTNFLESNVLLEDNPEPEADLLTTLNRREVEIYGLEVRWDWRGGKSSGALEGFEGGFSFAWTEGERTDIDQPLNSVEPWRAVSYLGYAAKGGGWGVRLTGTYIGEKDAKDIDQTTAAGILDPVASVFLIDLSGRVSLNENLRLNAGINNLTDEEYFLWSTARRGAGHGSGATADLNTQPGIHAFISLTAEF
ncbi:MAG: TonB-dependent receptor, partial [Oceanipulchritudo sp.]